MAGPDGYAGVMLSVKLPYFWRNSANGDSVRDRGTECTVHGAENSRRREVAKPGIALGSGPRDRGFESRLPDQFFTHMRIPTIVDGHSGDLDHRFRASPSRQYAESRARPPRFRFRL